MTNKRKSRSAGGVVLNRRGEVLVVSQKGTSWSFPKGHVDPGEDDLTAAKREIYEESGVKQLELQGDLGSYQRHRIATDGGEDTSELKTIQMFLFTTTEDALAPVDPENPEARWVPQDQVADLLTHAKDKEFFKKLNLDKP